MSWLSDWLYGGSQSLRADLDLGTPGPCLVVGSAPTAQLPAGYDTTWRVLCMNGSPGVAARLGSATPDIVLMRSGLFGDLTVDVEATESLRGQRGRTILARNWGGGKGASEQRLREIEYTFDRVRSFSKDERRSVVHDAIGSWAAFGLGRKDLSSGVICVMLASVLERAPIVITGISLASPGHFYSSSNLPRRHVHKDRLALRAMVRRGVPLYTTDPVLAGDVGMPVWTSGLT